MQLVDYSRPVSYPLLSRPVAGNALRRTLDRLARFFRSDDDPPDHPGALGASDLELLMLSRASRMTTIRQHDDAVARVMHLGRMAG